MTRETIPLEKLIHSTKQLSSLALTEDLATFTDITTEAALQSLSAVSQTLPKLASKKLVRATLTAKQTMLVCGLPLVKTVLQQTLLSLQKHKSAHSLLPASLPYKNKPTKLFISEAFELELLSSEGALLKPGRPLLRLSGNPALLLLAERPLLNLCMLLSGVATLTAEYVKALAGTGIKVCDTRKTIPGFRFLQKYAVHIGGGENHRIGLYDAYLVKDNHIDWLGGIAPALQAMLLHRKEYRENKARTRAFKDRLLEIECRSLAEVKQVLSLIPYGLEPTDFLLLDNFDDAKLEAACKLIQNKLQIEASGNMNLARMPRLRHLALNRISIGMLTHSAPAADISMNFSGLS